MSCLREVLSARRCTGAVWGIVLGIVLYILTRPLLAVFGEEEALLLRFARPGDALSIGFIHSVQKTRVIENHIINEQCDGFVLKSTKYQSFGVGLPFLASEGNFRMEGDYFIMDDFDRPFKEIVFRAGVGTELTLTYHGKEYPVYRQVPVGGRIDIKLGRLYEILWQRLVL